MIDWKLFRAALDAPRWVFEMELLTLAYLAAKCAKDGRALEIGSWCGASTTALMAGMISGTGTLQCIDNWNGNDVAYRKGVTGEQVRMSFFRRLQPFIASERVTVFDGDYRDIAPRLERASYDLIFIDGPHGEEHTKPTIDLVLPLLKQSGTIVFHDAACGGWPGVLAMCKQVIDSGEFAKPRLVETMAIFERGNNDSL